MTKQNDIDMSPVSSQQGRRWLVESLSPDERLRSSVVISRHHPAAATPEKTTDHAIQNTFTSRTESAAGSQKKTTKTKVPAAAKLPSPAERMNRVQITSVTIPDVSLVRELSQALNPHIPDSESIDTIQSNPKKIAACLAAASEETLTNVAKENNLVFLSQTVVSADEVSVDYFPIADAEETPQKWTKESNPGESDRVSSPIKTGSPALPQKTCDTATSDSPLEMLPTRKESTQIASEVAAPIAVETPIVGTHPPTNRPIPADDSPSSQSSVQPTNDNQQELEGELAGVVDSILKRATAGQPTLLLFVASEANRHVDSTSATVASILAKRRLGSVLLIDSNADSRELTFSSGQQNQPGLVEAVLEQADWSPMIRTGAASGVDFLPLGQRDFSGTRFQPRLRKLVSELKQTYDYICVSAGSSDSVDSRLWSDISDGCYLLVSQKNANQTLAQSAVAELQASGARLLGCVVTDTEG